MVSTIMYFFKTILSSTNESNISSLFPFHVLEKIIQCFDCHHNLDDNEEYTTLQSPLASHDIQQLETPFYTHQHNGSI